MVCSLFLTFGFLLISIRVICDAKYVDGHLQTYEDWAFLARFCFISDRGVYEYEIEFDRRLGEPSMLLYFDEQDQWPAVYKSDKSCHQKLSVLSVADNQIIKLSARSPYNHASGCRIVPKEEKTTTKTTTTTPTTTATTPAPTSMATSTIPFTSKSFLVTTPSSAGRNSSHSSEIESMEISKENETSSISDEADVFNSSSATNEIKRKTDVDGRQFRNDMMFTNSLENTTEYRKEVEELFESNAKESSVRQSASSQRFSRRNRGTRETWLVRCHNGGKFSSARQRWWYIAISNCGSDKGLDITYRFKMTNGPEGDFWSEHYSADEMLIPPILLIEAIIYSMIIVAVFFCTVELKNLHLYHCTYRLFSFSVMLQYVGVLIQGITWTKYGLTGIGPNQTLGAIFMGASEITFLLLLLLMAKGYTITRARLSSCSIVKLTMFINTYIVAYISLFIYQAIAFDPGEVLNLFESPAGLGLSLLRCIAWCAFMISTATTTRKNPEKKSFYYPLGLFGTIWLLGGPFITLLGIGVLDPWVRESVMFGTFAIMAFGGHSAFLWLTWPSRANKSFPYHVRTNHVGIASEEDDGADYPRHTYEPSAASAVDQNVIIPLSRRTEELINGIYGHYIYEQSNIHSHASFPEDRNAPPDILSTEQLSDQFAVQMENDLSRTDLRQRLAEHFGGKTDGAVTRPMAEVNSNGQELENQNDSGHLSLEHTDSTCSPSNATTKSLSNERSPKRENRSQSIDSTKSNVITVNGKPIPPNKIILEPIEQSLRSMKSVPKHLFTAKKRTPNENNGDDEKKS